MTWTTFGLWLTLAYMAWYILNLAFDLLMNSRASPVEASQEELFFEESSPPELVAYLEDAPATDLPDLGAPALMVQQAAISSGKIQATGSVSIAELLIRAKDELIEHTRAIPY